MKTMSSLFCKKSIQKEVYYFVQHTQNVTSIKFCIDKVFISCYNIKRREVIA
nr:MAG TPA: hypothetical protein [Caudoviricetes sp.]